ncbi:hypothetical protein T03_1368 [Trichinella britovi]|uniref:Uncharacterized protein n=1 Tax=Trichinella britovi TaxID=45882 RepID=A0A0V1CSH7_TRIBR|nr:hypothetical protein T03_1368 [Trichinella britovi]
MASEFGGLPFSIHQEEFLPESNILSIMKQGTMTKISLLEISTFFASYIFALIIDNCIQRTIWNCLLVLE